MTIDQYIKERFAEGYALAYRKTCSYGRESNSKHTELLFLPRVLPKLPGVKSAMLVKVMAEGIFSAWEAIS